MRHHRGPEVGLEVIEAAPGAAGQTVGSLEAGDPGLDPGARPPLSPLESRRVRVV